MYILDTSVDLNGKYDLFLRWRLHSVVIQLLVYYIHWPHWSWNIAWEIYILLGAHTSYTSYHLANSAEYAISYHDRLTYFLLEP